MTHSATPVRYDFSEGNRKLSPGGKGQLAG
jgi:hypothetical protein